MYLYRQQTVVLFIASVTLLAEMQRRETAREMSSSPPSRELAPLIEEHKTNGAMANGSTPSAAVATGTMAWLGEASFVDCFGESVTREKLETADIIGVGGASEHQVGVF